jgi:Ca2+-binding RTX toxin-like protein
VLVGGTGADTFAFAAGYGQDRVTLFENGTDKVDLTGLTFAQLTETAIAGGVRVSIIGTPTTFIELIGVTMAQVEAGDFI